MNPFKINIEKKKIKITYIGKNMADTESDLLTKIMLQNNITTDTNNKEITLKQERENKHDIVTGTRIIEQYKDKGRIIYRMGCLLLLEVSLMQRYKYWKVGQQTKVCKSQEDVFKKCAGNHKSNESNTDEIICRNF